MSGGMFRDTRTLTAAEAEQMNDAATVGDMVGWSAPVIDAMSAAMETVKRQMIAAGMRPVPGHYSFSIVFEAEGVPQDEQARGSA